MILDALHRYSRAGVPEWQQQVRAALTKDFLIELLDK